MEGHGTKCECTLSVLLHITLGMLVAGEVVYRRLVQGVNCRLGSGCLTWLCAGLWLLLGHGVWDGAWDMFRGCTWTQGWDGFWDGQGSAMGCRRRV